MRPAHVTQAMDEAAVARPGSGVLAVPHARKSTAWEEQVELPGHP